MPFIRHLTSEQSKITVSFHNNISSTLLKLLLSHDIIYLISYMTILFYMSLEHWTYYYATICMYICHQKQYISCVRGDSLGRVEIERKNLRFIIHWMKIKTKQKSKLQKRIIPYHWQQRTLSAFTLLALGQLKILQRRFPI